MRIATYVIPCPKGYTGRRSTGKRGQSGAELGARGPDAEAGRDRCGLVDEQAEAVLAVLGGKGQAAPAADREVFDLDWVQSMLHLMAAEARELRPGGGTLIMRLADILVIQAIRSWLDSAAHSGASSASSRCNPPPPCARLVLPRIASRTVCVRPAIQRCATPAARSRNHMTAPDLTARPLETIGPAAGRPLFGQGAQRGAALLRLLPDTRQALSLDW